MWEDLELDPERIPLFKLIFHSLQIAFAFVLWCLEIAVFRADGSKIVGNNGWTFAAFFISVPAWLYLMLAPRSPRVRKMAEPHVMLVVDALFTIIWLSAFATQASYNTANLCGSACSMSKAIVALGFFVFLFFCVTTFFSIWTLKYYQMNNRLPGYDRGQLNNQNIDPDKAAFSMAPHDEEYAPVNMSDHDNSSHLHHHDHDDDLHYGGAGSVVGGRRSTAPHSDYSDPYGPVGNTSQVGTVSSAYQDNPFRQHEDPATNPFDSDSEYHSGRVSAAGNRYAPPIVAANPFDADNEYHSGGGRVSAAGSRYAAPTATDVYDDHHDAARFPVANYDRIER